MIKHASPLRFQPLRRKQTQTEPPGTGGNRRVKQKRIKATRRYWVNQKASRKAPGGPRWKDSARVIGKHRALQVPKHPARLPCSVRPGRVSPRWQRRQGSHGLRCRRSGVVEQRADANVAGGRGSDEWAPRHPGGGSDRPPRRSPSLPSPPQFAPSPSCHRPLGGGVLRSPTAPVALRGPQVRGMSRCSATPPPHTLPQPPSPLASPHSPSRQSIKLPRVTEKVSAHAPNDTLRGTTLSRSLRDNSILDHVMKFGARCITAVCCPHLRRPGLCGWLSEQWTPLGGKTEAEVVQCVLVVA